ncbi:MAG: molybdenum cofactor guanylyltransferase [Ilumatobacteraceae bacterium]
MQPSDPAAGVVLAGGRSSRMGTPKGELEWHGSTLLYRTAALLARTVNGPVVVVAAPGQDLPGLPAGVRVVEDPIEGLGPMEGIATGLASVEADASVAFVCSTDMPFLHPAFVQRVLRAFAETDTDVVLPIARGFRQPLAAAYRTSLVGLISELAATGNLRPAMLFEHCRVHQISDLDLLADSGLARFDADLDSVTNLNTPEDYAAARQRPPAVVTVQCFGALAADGGRGPQEIRAATLGDAAAAVGISLDNYVMAALNGDLMTRDAQLPLVSGDTIALLSADAGG